MRALLRSAEELRKAQQRALSGKGARELQERLGEQRRAVRALARLGRELLTAEGRSVSDGLVDRIEKTLAAAALDEGSRFLLRAGVLSEELEPQGFDALAGMASPPRARGQAAPAGRDETARARQAVQSAREQARERAREATEAERQAKRAESAAASARRQARSAQERSAAAEQALAEAEAALRKARRRR